MRRLVVDRVRAAVAAGELEGDAIDVAHVVVALIQGLAAAESSHRMGRSKASVDRRCRLGVDALFRGLAPSAV